MISINKLIQMSRKWKEMAMKQKKGITFKRSTKKGHFVVYSMDERRFEIPLEYLKSEIFQELFRMAEEEFGFISNGPTRLPSDATLIDYAISLIQRNVAKEVQQTLHLTLSSYHLPQHPHPYMNLLGLGF